MPVDEAGKWLAVTILEQSLFTKPVYQEKSPATVQRWAGDGAYGREKTTGARCPKR